MNNPVATQNRRSLPNPDLADAFDQSKKDIFLSMNCHHIAVIQEFNSTEQTVKATIAYKKTFSLPDKSGVYVPVYRDYAILVDVPIIRLKGGPAGVTFPIAVGDECMILFNDRDMDNWFQSGQIGAPASGRLHNFSDGFALIGVSSRPNKLTDYDTTRASLFNGTTRVAAGADKVLIENVDTTLKTLLNELIQNIKDLVTQVAAITVTGVTSGGGISGPPSNVAAINAITSDLTDTATDIAGLLE